MAYPELTRRTAFAAAVETAPGVDAAPTLADHGIRLVGPLTVEEFYLEENARNDVLYGGLGTLAPERPAGRAFRFRGRAVLTGAGAAYSATVLPEVHPLLVAAGFAPAVDTGTAGSEAVRYATSDDPAATLTAIAYMSGKLYRVTGGVLESFNLSCDAGGFPTLEFSVVGIGQAPAEQAIGTLPTDDVAYPIWRGAGSLDVSGAAGLVARSISAGLSLSVTPRASANGSDAHAGYRITGRQAGVQVRAEVSPLTTWNPYQDRAQRTPRTVAARFGQTQYERVRLDVANAQAMDVDDVDDNGLRVYNVSYLAARAAAGAELTLTFD